MVDSTRAPGAAQTGEKYGLLTYRTKNLGDEVQSVAAAQFLPAINLRIDRDQLGQRPDGADDQYKIILNGWHSHAPERWPPGPFLTPLLTSIHITGEIFPPNVGGLKPAEVLVRGKNRAFLQNHGPVGARDIWTRDLLLSHGIDAFFSGCLTLTLGTGDVSAKGDYVCAVDLPARLSRRLRELITSRLVFRTHHYPAPSPFGERTYLARRHLSLYAGAKCVVTTRLHCALPSLAMGTPVLFICTAQDSYRFSGLSAFLHTCTPQEFLDGVAGFDPENPPPNPEAHKPYRAALIAAANGFVDASAASSTVPLRPFVPEPVTDTMLDETPPAPEDGAAAADADAVFRKVFPVGRDYSADLRPDFLRDVARVYEKTGDRGESARLLRSALLERPNGALIRQRLSALESPQDGASGPGAGPSAARQREPNPLIAAVRERRRTYLSVARLESLLEQAGRVTARSVPGNFIECGIGLGGSGICIASRLDGSRQYWGFDVFGMIPPPSETDGDSAKERYDVIVTGRAAGIGSDLYYGYVPELYTQVAASFAELGLQVDGETINLVPGLFQDSLPRHVTFPIAMAHIDCDWYDHVKFCLNSIRDLVSLYGVIVVDDYNHWPGCKQAVDEFLAENDNMLLQCVQPHAIILKT